MFVCCLVNLTSKQQEQESWSLGLCTTCFPPFLANVGVCFQGCYDKVEEWLDDNKHLLGTIAMCVLVIQVSSYLWDTYSEFQVALVEFLLTCFCFPSSLVWPSRWHFTNRSTEQARSMKPEGINNVILLIPACHICYPHLLFIGQTRQLLCATTAFYLTFLHLYNHLLLWIVFELVFLMVTFWKNHVIMCVFLLSIVCRGLVPDEQHWEQRLSGGEWGCFSRLKLCLWKNLLIHLDKTSVVY